MALYSGLALVLLYGWSSLCIGYCAMLNTDSRKVDFTRSEKDTTTTTTTTTTNNNNNNNNKQKDDMDLLLQDTMTEHMQMLYAKYNRAGFPFKDGNTVRSFKAHWGRCPSFYSRLHSAVRHYAHTHTHTHTHTHIYKYIYINMHVLVQRNCQVE